jgi:peptidoglycan/xylan/chitin deacetylase (PgdA/CDA1 family)
MQKSYLIMPFLITLLVSGLLLLIINSDSHEIGEFTRKEGGWTIKKREVYSRLLAVPILLYHNIDGKGRYSLELSELRKHFEYFKRKKIKVVSLADLHKRLKNPVAYEGKSVVITFDDGFRSMYYKLLPLVKKYKYPVTLFVYTDFIRAKARNMLTWKNLREMDKNGIDVQCHTKTHIDLAELVRMDTSAADSLLFKEMLLSKEVLELKLNKKIDFLAYPYGEYNLKVIQLSKMAGYERVFSTNSGSNIITRNNYCLNRHHILNSYTIEKISQIIK